MVQIKILYFIILVLGFSLVTNASIGFSFSQASQLNTYGNSDYLNTKVQTNSLNLSKPIYQATNSTFFATQNISSKPFSITKEFVFEKGIMKDIGNVTNNMTFINTYFPDNSIQAKGNGTLKTIDGQKIDWISSDIGIISSKGYTFQGIVSFNNTNSEKLSFLNHTVGIYKESPEIKRTMWLIH
jgi:hypothetical protein